MSGKKEGRMTKKIFIITCNPKEHSLKDFYVRAYVDEATKNGHDVRIINLYDLNMDFLRFKDGEADRTLTPELKQAQDNLIWADQTVIIYSLWCFGIPSILKCFIERTFALDVIWKFGKMGPEPVLKDKTAVIIQSYSMPKFMMKYMLGDVPFKFWKVLLGKWAGFKIVKRVDIDMVDNIPEKKKEKLVSDIKKFISKL